MNPDSFTPDHVAHHIAHHVAHPVPARSDGREGRRRTGIEMFTTFAWAVGLVAAFMGAVMIVTSDGDVRGLAIVLCVTGGIGVVCAIALSASMRRAATVACTQVLVDLEPRDITRLVEEFAIENGYAEPQLQLHPTRLASRHTVTRIKLRPAGGAPSWPLEVRIASKRERRQVRIHAGWRARARGHAYELVKKIRSFDQHLRQSAD